MNISEVHNLFSSPTVPFQAGESQKMIRRLREMNATGSECQLLVKTGFGWSLLCPGALLPGKNNTGGPQFAGIPYYLPYH